ncbi:hypothetical protein [Candidatus Methylomirabilis sp.]|uniref:hypothetical protein n=1 Tax=Candidatus Methylomirabilis sp. TaxID=2032687 RepID=UPI002A608A5D|nr:hypothetical protein [Candidatus Methylomirabilis sp.]
MDGLSKVSEPLPDVAVAEQAREGRWQASSRPKGAARRRPKKGEPGWGTASDDRRDSHAEEDGGSPPQTDPDKETPADQEVSGACYGRDKAIAPTLPSKGRLIDIAV